jgi:hypothetical protein
VGRCTGQRLMKESAEPTSKLLREYSWSRTHLWRKCIMNTVPPHTQDGNPPQKRCTGPCGRLFPATTEFFHRNAGRLRNACKTCRNDKSKEDYHTSPVHERKLAGERKRCHTKFCVMAHSRKVRKPGLDGFCAFSLYIVTQNSIWRPVQIVHSFMLATSDIRSRKRPTENDYPIVYRTRVNTASF